MALYEIENLMPKRRWFTRPDGSKTWKYLFLTKRPSHTHRVAFGISKEIDANLSTQQKKHEFEQHMLKLVTFYLPDLVAYAEKHDIVLEATHGYTWHGYSKICFYAKGKRRRLAKMLDTIGQEKISKAFVLLRYTDPFTKHCIYNSDYHRLYLEFFNYEFVVSQKTMVLPRSKIGEVVSAPWTTIGSPVIDKSFRFSSDHDRVAIALMLS